jgi:hypothetical protein
MGEMRNVYKILVRKPEGKRTHRKPTRKWKETKNFLKTGCEDVG